MNLYIETYGCQMNFSDSEIIYGLMEKSGYNIINDINKADIILLNTCSVREHAEERVIQRIHNLRMLKNFNKDIILGVIGCMAERMKEKLFDIDDNIDLILGPDEYRNLPMYLSQMDRRSKVLKTEFNNLETYEDILPHRTGNISAWIPIMRGCDNFCSYCIVPYTRGKERSRSLDSILKEANELNQQGFKELYLLGQNVNSYKDEGRDFSDLLEAVSKINTEIRVRFMTSHPKDLSDRLIETIKNNDNICKSLHLPFQSGSNNILQKMNRNYTREHYMNLIEKIKYAIPEIGLSTDVIVGYPNESDNDFEDTLDLMRQVKFDNAYMFKYSPREGTEAFKLTDNIPEETKAQRLDKLISVQQEISTSNNQKHIGDVVRVLAQGESKKSYEFLKGRMDNNKIVVFPKNEFKTGDFVRIKITKSSPATLIGETIQ